MANENSGVRIPVIIDIDQACKDAAARVDQAMKPLQRKLETTELNIRLADSLKDGSLRVEDLEAQIKHLKKSLTEVAMTTGANSKEFKGLLEAYHYVKDLLDAVNITRKEIEGMANSINGLNSQLAASRMALQNSAIESPEWNEAAKRIRKITEELAKYEAKMREIGAEEGSLDKLNSQLTELERKWAALSGADRRGQEGQRLLAQYKQITAEIEKSGKSMRQLVEEERKKGEVLKQNRQNRKYERWALENVGKTMEQLRQQAQFLQQQMDRTEPHTEKWNQYKNQLDAVNAKKRELEGNTEKVNRKMRQTNEVMTKQSVLWSQLRGLAGMYISVFGGLRLLKNIREVTAQFELQEVALGSILQNTQQASILFKELKTAALESPFEIKDLVTYTKQLAAYQIETDKLFETTKKLADVSAGLGVDMGRLILAYGQVRAASVLRGQELRQFTEAGVPLVDKLADKFSKLRGEMVSTGEVFELISKRAVPFSMISEIFDDMTERGGIFYDMQRKQSETLYGQWQKLKDAASIMYDEMGKTGPVRNGLESLLALTMDIMRNWRSFANIISTVGIGFIALKARAAFIPTLTKNTALLRQSTILLARAQVAYNAGSEVTSRNLIKQALLLRKASEATTAFGRAMRRLQASMVAFNWTGLVITALSALIGWFISARAESNKLRDELARLDVESKNRAESAEANFRRLASAATDSSRGLAEQQKAVEELQRTYGDIIPAQKLQIEYLQTLKGNYSELTDAILENISAETKRAKLQSINDSYSTKIKDAEKKVKRTLKTAYGFSEEDAEAALIAFRDKVSSGLYDVNATIKVRGQEAEKLFRDYFGKDIAATYFNVQKGELAETLIGTRLSKLAKILQKFRGEIDKLDTSMAEATAKTGVYAEELADMEKKISKIPDELMRAYADDKSLQEKYKTVEGWKNSFEYEQKSILRKVEEWRKELSSLLKGIDISEAFKIEGTIDFRPIYDSLDKADSRIFNAVNSIKKSYSEILPTDPFVMAFNDKIKAMAKDAGVPFEVLKNILGKDGDDIQAYIKKINEALTNYQTTLLKTKIVVGVTSAEMIDQANKAIPFLEDLLKKIDEGKKTTGGGAYKQDPFIQLMQDRIGFMKDFKKGYEDLNKYMSANVALDKQSATMEYRGTVLGIDVKEQQRAATDLIGWYKEQRDKAMEEMRKAGGRGTTLKELLGMDVGKNKKLKDFQQLLLSLSDAITDLETSDALKKLEKALNDLADKVKRSELARNFFQNILDLTGDKELAANLSVGVYGDPGSELADRIRESIEKAMSIEGLQSDSAIWQTLTQAAKSMDFRKVMDQIDQLPKGVQKAVKEAAEAVEKYQTDMAKSYAKLLMSYNDIEMQRVEINNKAAEKIKTIEEGLALELKAIREKGGDSSKIAEAQIRAAKATAAVEREQKAELYKLSRDYRLFFNTVNILSVETARQVASHQKAILAQQLAAGEISFARYKREMREIDEQLHKYESRKSPFLTYWKEGLDALFDLLKQRADDLQGLAATISGEDIGEHGVFTPSEEAKDFLQKIDKTLNKGLFARIFKKKNVVTIEQRISKASQDAYTKTYEDMVNTVGEVKAADAAAQQAQAAASQEAAAAGQEAAGAANEAAEGAAWAAFWIQNIYSLIDGLDQRLTRGGEEEAPDWLNKLAEAATWTIGIRGDQSWDRLAALNSHAMEWLNAVKSGDIAGSFMAVWDAIYDTFGPNQRKINRELKRQQEILSELEYQYNRLDVAIDKAFGESYIYNYNKQLENLVAQQEAYLKQAELERSKGKKKDKDKIKDYEDKARETADKIADMQSQLSEFFTGTDLTSAAEDFAKAWLEAYKEFGNTTDAMSEKFNDMIESMITRSLAAKIMQTILQPLFDQIDQMARDGDLSTTEIAEIARIAPAYVEKMNEAMTALANDMAAAGYNLRGNSAKLTGISRDIAGASEESILGLSAAINTQNFYISNIPVMRDQLSQIIALMGGGTQGNTAVSEAPETDLKLHYLSYLPTIASDVTEILVNLKRVISPNGAATATHYISIR